MEKQFKTRISHKIDIEENWNKATNFIPLKGEIIIYDIDANNENRRIKIGDGVKNVIDLDFLALPSNGQVIAPGGNAAPQVQTDYSQNDSTAVDYIKNRPFYDTSWSIEWDGSPTTEFFDATNTMGAIIYKVNNDIKTVDELVGAEIQYTEDSKIIKHILSLDDIQYSDNEKFIILFHERYGLCAIIFENNTTDTFMGFEFNNLNKGIWFVQSADYSPFYLGKINIQQIDTKFLPDIRSDWNQNNINSINYISNRPFYETTLLFEMIQDNLVNYKPFVLDIFNLTNYGEKIGVSANGIFERVEGYKVSDKVLTEEELLGSVLCAATTENLPFLKAGIELLEKIYLDEDFFNDYLLYQDNDCIITPYFIMSKIAKTITLESGETVNIPSSGTYLIYSFQEGGGIVSLSPQTSVNLNNSLVMDIDANTIAIIQKTSEDFIPLDYLSQSTISLSFEDMNISIDSAKVLAMSESFLTPEIIPEGWVLMYEEEMPVAISLSTDTQLPGPNNELISLTTGTYLISVEDKNTKEVLCKCNKIFRQNIIKKIDNKFLPKVSTFNTSFIATNIVPIGESDMGVDAIICNFYQFLIGAMATGFVSKNDLLFKDMQFADTLVIKNAGEIEGMNFGTCNASNGSNIIIGIPHDMTLGENILDFTGMTIQKTITLNEVLIDVGKAFDIIAIADPTNPTNYVGTVIYGGGGDGSDIIIDQTVQENSEYAVSSKAVYNAIQNIRITTDAKIVEGSANPVSGGAVYEALQGYKIRVSDTPPTAEDNLDDNIITFVF